MSSVNKSEDQLREILDLFFEVQSRIGNNLETQADAYGLCGSQLLILMDVLAHPGTGLTESCERTRLKKSAASKLVEALVTKGFLTRTEVKGDRRAVALEVGQSFLAKGFCSRQTFEALLPGRKNVSPSLQDLDHIVSALKLLTQLAKTHGS